MNIKIHFLIFLKTKIRKFFSGEQLVLSMCLLNVKFRGVGEAGQGKSSLANYFDT